MEPSESGTSLASHNQAFLELKKLDEERDALEAKLTAVKQRRTEVEESLVKLMDDQQVNRITIAGITFYRHTDNFPRAKEGEQDALFQWLQTEGRGDLIKPTVNAQSLRSMVVERMKENQPLPECLELFTVNRVRTRNK